MRFNSYLNTAIQILGQYKGEQPFSFFLKKYFAQNRKYGSRDRKEISHLCYCYFRLGKALSQLTSQERILAGLFLCSGKSNELLEELKPEWDEQVRLSLKEKLLILHHSLHITDVFPWISELSEGIDHEKFSESFFIQPGLFLRMRPGHESEVKRKLQDAGFYFKDMGASCLSLPNNSRIENIIELDKEAVVQDYNSQQTAGIFKLAHNNYLDGDHKLPTIVWDCCAGSGGKSLLLYDNYPDIDLTVSDIRESILVNLKKRFAKAGIKKYKSLICDLTNDLQTVTGNFDLIICDAPCTGSGTWSRTPEQLYFFHEKKIEHYAALQKKIVGNVVSHLKINSFLAYITCSVFKKENEEAVKYLQEKFQLKLIRQDLLKGYDQKADTMFAALLKKEL